MFSSTEVSSTTRPGNGNTNYSFSPMSQKPHTPIGAPSVPHRAYGIPQSQQSLTHYQMREYSEPYGAYPPPLIRAESQPPQAGFCGGVNSHSIVASPNAHTIMEFPAGYQPPMHEAHHQPVSFSSRSLSVSGGSSCSPHSPGVSPLALPHSSNQLNAARLSPNSPPTSGSVSPLAAATPVVTEASSQAVPALQSLQLQPASVPTIAIRKVSRPSFHLAIGLAPTPSSAASTDSGAGAELPLSAASAAAAAAAAPNCASACAPYASEPDAYGNGSAALVMQETECSSGAACVAQLAVNASPNRSGSAPPTNRRRGFQLAVPGLNASFAPQMDRCAPPPQLNLFYSQSASFNTHILPVCLPMSVNHFSVTVPHSWQYRIDYYCISCVNPCPVPRRAVSTHVLNSYDFHLVLVQF